MAARKKKRSGFKKAAVAVTLLAALLGVSYKAIPQVKETIDDKIVEVIRKGGSEFLYGNLVELKPVTNLSFDRKTATLTFDENPDAIGYTVNVRYHGKGYGYKSDDGKFEVKLEDVLKGDVIEFEVIAKGDNKTTTDSKRVKLEYTIESNDPHYEASKYFLDGILKSSTISFGKFGISSFEARSFDIQGDHFIIEGVGKSRAMRDINFTAKYDMTKYKKENSSDFTNLINYRFFLNYVRNHINNDLTITAEYADSYVNMSELLERNDAFKEYSDLGYEIETLQHSNSEIYTLYGENFIEHTGIYRAVHETLPSVTFKQTNKISIKSEEKYYSVQEFLEAADKLAVITEESKEIYDAVVNEHLLNTLEADISTIKTTSSERSKE